MQGSKVLLQKSTLKMDLKMAERSKIGLPKMNDLLVDHVPLRTLHDLSLF